MMFIAGVIVGAVSVAVLVGFTERPRIAAVSTDQKTAKPQRKKSLLGTRVSSAPRPRAGRHHRTVLVTFERALGTTSGALFGAAVGVAVSSESPNVCLPWTAAVVVPLLLASVGAFAGIALDMERFAYADAAEDTERRRENV